MRRSLAGYIVLTLVVGAASASRPSGRSTGRDLYDRYCLACHGEAGDGKGPAAPFTWSTPRSFVAGNYKWKSTVQGSAPTDEDLRTAIRFGAPGTSMPGFAFTNAELADVMTVVKQFSPTTFNSMLLVKDIRPAQANRGRASELWSSAGCASCHGMDGKGAGPSAYDLTNTLHRPRANDDVETRRRGAAQSIASGIAGSAMPAFDLPVADLWALADRVIELNGSPTPRTSIALDPAQVAADQQVKLDTGIGTGVWATHLAPQGPPPSMLAPAEASLSAQQCARCHAKQAREWKTSVHGAAGSPGLFAQLDDGTADTCKRCHAPLAEQIGDRTLATEGVTCAGCHLRSWTRHGPPDISEALLPIPTYPRVTDSQYERADFCMPCHQLPPRSGLSGKPFLNTFKEWLEGPYMRRGVQCQHCHMPNREHTWLGVHDRDTFKQGIRLDVVAKKTDRGASVVAELHNVGAGHYLPTTSTPAVWLRIELLDRQGTPIDGARAELRIGRDLWFDGAWHERSDTRIPPGARAQLVKAWQAGRAKDAATARVTVEVHPDDYYEGFYRDHLAKHLAPAIRAQYEQALARSTASHYIAEQRDVALE